MKKLLTLLTLSLSLSHLTVKAQWDTLITNTTTNFTSGYFYAADSGVVVGYDGSTNTGRIFRTVDGGTTWTTPTVNSSLPRLNACGFFSDMIGIIAGDSGKVFRSADGGASWILDTLFTSENLTSVSCPTNLSIFVAGADGGLYRSMDGGFSWTTQNSGTLLPITDLDFVYANTGWVIGNGGYLGVTADAGATWNYYAQPHAGFFQPRGFTYAGSTNTAYCVGENGVGIFSLDAGLTWYDFWINTINDLNSVKFGSDFSGVICGNNNFIYRTNNNGASWVQDAVPGDTSDLNKVCWGDPSTCYIVGTNGRILKNNTDISGIHETNSYTIEASVFPNPVSDVFNLQFHLDVASTGTISVFDMQGREVLPSISFDEQAGNHVVQTNASDLAPGMYLVTVRTDNGTTSIPMLKN